MTLQIWKERLIGAVFSSVAIYSCAHALGSRKPPRDIKIYSHQPTESFCKGQTWCLGKVGFVRSQAQEIVEYENAEGWFAVTPEDLSRLIATCPQVN